MGTENFGVTNKDFALGKFFLAISTKVLLQCNFNVRQGLPFVQIKVFGMRLANDHYRFLQRRHHKQLRTNKTRREVMKKILVTRHK